MLSQQQGAYKDTKGDPGIRTFFSFLNASVSKWEGMCKGVRSTNVLSAEAWINCFNDLFETVAKAKFLKEVDWEIVGRVETDSDYEKDIQGAYNFLSVGLGNSHC